MSNVPIIGTGGPSSEMFTEYRSNQQISVPANQYLSLMNFSALRNYQAVVSIDTTTGRRIAFTVFIDHSSCVAPRDIVDLDNQVTRVGWAVVNSSTRELLIQFNQAITVNQLNISVQSEDHNDRINRPARVVSSGVGSFYEAQPLARLTDLQSSAGLVISTGFSTDPRTVNIPEGPTVSSWTGGTMLIPEAERGFIIRVRADTMLSMNSSGFVGAQINILQAWYLGGVLVKRDRYMPKALNNASSVYTPIPSLLAEFAVPNGSGAYTLRWDIGFWKEGSAHSAYYGGAEAAIRHMAVAYHTGVTW